MSWLRLALLAEAAPVELPPDAPAGPWANPLALAGLHVGPVGTAGAGARLGRAGDGRWWLWVRGDDGAEHVLQVDAPEAPAEREALAALVASLLHPVRLPDLPPPTPAPTRRPAAPPRAVEASPGIPAAPRPVRIPTPPPPEPIGSAPIRALPSSPSPPAPPLALTQPAGWRWWAGIGPSLRMRPSVRSVPAGGVWAGVAGDVGAPVRLGFGLEAAAPGALVELDTDGRMAAVDLRGAAAWAPGAWELGPVAALSVRILADPFAAAHLAPQPVVGAFLARRLPLGPGAVRLALGVERDLVPWVLHDADGSVTKLQPWSGAVGVGFWTR